MRKLSLLILTVPALAAAAPLAQDPNSASGGGLEVVAQRAEKLLRAAQSFQDWEQHSTYIMDAVSRIYDRNGWDSESDYFSLDLMGEIEALPPWDVYGRFGTFLDRVGERYLLTDAQRESLQNLVVRGATEVFTKHSDRIMTYAIDAIQTRAAGEPFTPEQVARWAALSEPVFHDMRRTMREGSEEFMRVLEPEQRELLREDMHAADRRLDVVQRGFPAWKRGEWDPAQWGLDADPIQNPGAAELEDGGVAAGAIAEAPAEPPPPPARAPRVAGGGPATPPPTPGAGPVERESASRPAKAVKAIELDDVGRFIAAFVRKYQLNDEQAQRAQLYGDDTRHRLAAVAARFERVAAGDSATEQARARRRGDVRTLFEALQRRLERLPTRAQRRSALDVELPLPADLVPAVGEQRGGKRQKP